ncbi:sugar (pentulose or hexulose) kinase [Neorhizobium galegae]|uniref:FGGY family carbohydrate kinase n=1 Tax=Neorhizobium galegae TaxID=399 RepID=UPI00278910C2|nr:FGGY family carbohydrate kinase [Neorhizobium galegae]MDQ0138058.1 sugar (pentulose or hexulose) kinase [Neorhizobium galegae]
MHVGAELGLLEAQGEGESSLGHDREQMPATAIVLDVGKTKLKASLIDGEGDVLRTTTIANSTVSDRDYRIQDVPRAWSFMKEAMADMMADFPVTDVIVSTHGSSGMLVNADGSTTPLPDYESEMPEQIERFYAEMADDLAERGSNIGVGPRHIAKQLFWLQHAHPTVFNKAVTLLPAPQYWAWKLSGVRSMDTTSLTAQSHLWNAGEKRFTGIVQRQGWHHLMPRVYKPHRVLGRLTEPALTQLGTSRAIRVRCGVHDSAANFHRYQAAGFKDFVLLSSGTWLVGLSDGETHSVPEGIDLTFQQSAVGTPIVSCRVMAGREFGILSGDNFGPAEPVVVNTLIARKTVALPSFQPRDGLVSGSAGKGRIVGPLPENSAENLALALLYYVMLADLCIEYLGRPKTIIVDGNITGQPLLGPLLKGLNPSSEVLISSSPDGTAVGAALLAGAGRAAVPRPINRQDGLISLNALEEYAKIWRASISN